MKTAYSTFKEQIKADIAHAGQIGSARRTAFFRIPENRNPELVNKKGFSYDPTQFPALATETKEDKECIVRVSAVRALEKAFAGKHGDADFRVTSFVMKSRKGITVTNGKVKLPVRQTTLASV